LSRVEALGKHASVVDWGCGLNHSPVSHQVRELDCDVLLSVDAWREYLIRLRGQAHTFRARAHHYLQGEVDEVALSLLDQAPDNPLPGDLPRHFDLSLCLDVVEHLEKPRALRWLEMLEQVSDRILVWIPLGAAPIDRDTYGGHNDYYHTHRSTWVREDLEALGYAVEVEENAHSAMFGHRVDAAWACKEVRR
jgi:hypothetical protein